MAPIKAAKSKPPARKNLARKSATAGTSSKSKPKSKLPPSLSKQVKTKSTAQSSKPRRKQPTYTEKQLSLPALNTIVPANAKIVQKAGGTGKKKGKVYVDDTEQMVAILKVVEAEREGELESKVAKMRKLEEVREAKKREEEKREEKARGKVEKVKRDIVGERRKSKKAIGKAGVNGDENKKDASKTNGVKKGKRKSVSFVD